MNGMLFSLQPHEQILDEAGRRGGKALVTTHRLIQSQSAFFGLAKDETYIPLEKIDSIQRKLVIPKELLVIAAAFGILGLINGIGFVSSILGWVLGIWELIVGFVLGDILGWIPFIPNILEWILLLPNKLFGFLEPLFSTGFGLALIVVAAICLIAAWIGGRQMVVFESGGGESIGISARGNRVEGFVEAVESAIRARAG